MTNTQPQQQYEIWMVGLGASARREAMDNTVVNLCREIGGIDALPFVIRTKKALAPQRRVKRRLIRCLVKPFLSQSQRENPMQIQINIDHNIENHKELAVQINGIVESVLNRISDHITRVEVHLSDENGQKNNRNDKRCMIEARIEGHQPIAVTHHASTFDQAVDGAADKLTRLIESTLGRLHDQKRHRTDPPPPGSELTEQS